MPKPGILDTLSADQKDQLFHWIEESCPEALRKVAAPPPEGFGIKTHITSLRRFYQRERMRRLAENLPIAVANLPRPEDVQALQASLASVLTHSAFEMATASRLSASDLFALLRALRSLREQELRREYLELARDKMDAAREELQMSAVFKKLEYYPGNCCELVDKAVTQILGAVPVVPPPRNGPSAPAPDTEDEHTKTHKNTIAQLRKQIVGS